MTTTITNYEQHGVCGVVEGQPKAVDKFLTNAGSGVKRGSSRRSEVADLTTNQTNVVKVTTYEPVTQPLGMPTLNDLFAAPIEHAASGTSLFAEPQPATDTPQPTKKKPGLFVAGAHPTDNGPLGLPDMQWDKPAETAEGERPRTNAAPQPGSKRNTRQAPLGLPSMDW